MLQTARPVLFTTAVGAVLGAIMTVLGLIIDDCEQLTNGNECQGRTLVVLLIGLPVVTLVAVLSIQAAVTGWRGPVIALYGGAVALAGLMLASGYGVQHAMWAAVPIGGLAFCCVACAVLPTPSPPARLAGGAVSLLVCVWVGILVTR
jgi:hypothetical protein